MSNSHSTEADTINDAPQTPLAEIRAQRIEKGQRFRDAERNPYGGRADNITSTADARQQYANAAEDCTVSVKLAGRLMSKRDMGKSCFCDVRDQSGRMQVYAQKNRIGEEEFELFKSLDIGDIVEVSGDIFTTRTEEVTLRAESFRLLSKSLRPLPEKWHGLTDVQQRYRQRYLDMISNPEVRDRFLARTQIVREIRRFLDERAYIEVETPMLQPIPGGAAARPFETFYHALDCPMYMRIAPELYLKRLLVGGFERVYEINRNFRNEGLSRNHNPEFTMLELYQAYGDCRSMMETVESLIVTVAERVVGSLTLQVGEHEINLNPPWRRVPYADLIAEHMGADWNELPTTEKAQKARDLQLSISKEMTDAEITHEIYEKVIEHTLIQPTFVTRLPVELVPLAKTCEDDPSVVDVFELEINGSEISPGYSELNDPLEQRRRFEQQRGSKTEADEQGALDEDFLAALEYGMPPAGGAGVGIDRLLMLMLNAASIRDVILFPQLRPTE
ncbi:MAG: lysine--tRNA ligase [Verrucomicrobiota bacterium]